MGIKHFPRNGRYELFTRNGRTYCFDDATFVHIQTKQEMFEWIRNHDTSLWSPLTSDPTSNVALYLQPELYMLWKLKWA